MKPAAREWIAKAEADFLSASREYRARKKPNFDAACFFAQQCIEKYLKGRLAEASRPIPKTHDLSNLLDAVLPLEPLWEASRSRLETLTSYSVLFRYPGESANRSLAKTAIADARWVRSMFRAALRLRGQ
ncbi:MAG: HEPN domain-containing protein [Planctomycetia bacterium]